MIPGKNPAIHHVLLLIIRFPALPPSSSVDLLFALADDLDHFLGGSGMEEGIQGVTSQDAGEPGEGIEMGLVIDGGDQEKQLCLFAILGSEIDRFRRWRDRCGLAPAFWFCQGWSSAGWSIRHFSSFPRSSEPDLCSPESPTSAALP